MDESFAFVTYCILSALHILYDKLRGGSGIQWPCNDTAPEGTERLYESLVRQKQLSSGVGAGAQQSRGPGLFRFSGTPLPGKTPAELEAAIDEEIAKIQSAPIADWELQKARNAARSSFISGLGSALNRAIQLTENALAFDDPGRINTRAAEIAKVTAADVQRVARQYLVKTNRTVVVTVPKAAAPKGVQ